MVASNGIARIWLDFSVNRETVIPPFSSKVSRSIVIRLLGEDNPLFAYKRYKPYACSPIFHGGKPLIKYDHVRSMPNSSSDDSRFLMLYPSREYTFALTVLDMGIVSSIFESKMNDIELFDSRFTITRMRFTATAMHNLRLEGDEFIMRFVTPVLLQLPRKWANIKRDGNVLFPLPSLLTWSAAQHWNMYASDDLKIDSCKRLAVYSNFSMVELDYSLKPMTVVYNEVSRPRGITGWVRWCIKSYNDTLDVQLRRVLAYTQYTGVGRSRSIGFGMVEIVTGQDDTSSRMLTMGVSNNRNQ